MAQVVTLRQAFQRLGFSNTAADILADVAKEGIDIDALQYFDDKGVKSLCATLRKPGGSINGPATADGRPVTQIPDPGVYVSTKAELNLTLTCYMARHYQRTGRTLTSAKIIIDRIQRYAQVKEAEEAYKEPNEILKLLKPDKIMDFIDDWPDHIALYNGQQGRPLAYVIRENATVKHEDEEPSFGEADSDFASLRDEVMSRASHETAQFRIDNARVYDLLNEAVTEHKHVKTWIKPYAAKRDGRAAWIAFKSHYRGSSEMESIEIAAERQLTNLVYTGERQRYSFELHVSKHRKAHQELEKATGTALPQATKVRRLLDSLQVATLAVPIATIKAQNNLRGDFDESVNYLKSFILSSSGTESRNVSAFKGQRFGKQHGKVNGNDKRTGGNKNKSSLDRYYKPDEWYALSDETRKKITDMRRKRKISQVNETDEETVKTSNASTTQRKKKGKTSA